jgi:predicted adenine nucleotide alpha hydrolase (AANH) superfamily ATPase
MKLLMHICCANCCLYPLQTFASRGDTVSGYWFNPNIHPYTEYRERLNTLKALHEAWGLDIHYEDRYGLKDFVRNIAGHEEERCGYCYAVRLEDTAAKARAWGMDAFTTSLLVSPYQKFDSIIAVGSAMAEKYNIEFLSEDFRPGYHKGVALSKNLGLYRQKYCGCVYSEMERYLGKQGA